MSKQEETNLLTWIANIIVKNLYSKVESFASKILE